jgi:NADH:ubiquinone oxidoreductase subunit 3 (subunit A)
MFKNWHVIIAMIVAPILAVLAWFAVDYFVAERPHAAKEGAAYSLIAKSNCRYDSGQCDLENAKRYARGSQQWNSGASG